MHSQGTSGRSDGAPGRRDTESCIPPTVPAVPPGTPGRRLQLFSSPLKPRVNHRCAPIVQKRYQNKLCFNIFGSPDRTPCAGPLVSFCAPPRGGAAGPRRRRPRRASRRPLPGAGDAPLRARGPPGLGSARSRVAPFFSPLSVLGPGPRCVTGRAGARPRPRLGPGPAPGPPHGHVGLTGRRDAGTPRRRDAESCISPLFQYPPGRRDVGYNFLHPP